ncbi:MAG: TonB family protein, partial [Candidatus Sungbacteria bacterium]|nr:TonB family protein [Candidatus Sungbacteria bacterium]
EKKAHNGQEKKHTGRTVVVGEPTTTTKPKKYVRGTTRPEKKAAEKDGNGSSVAGVAGGQEVISRYTQIISQWIINHQGMAKAACGEAKAVTGTCNARGQTVVRLRINREGHIISNTVERTSGNELVDQAAIIMVRASDPVPAAPANYPSDSMLEFLVAVQVDLSKK